MTDFLATMAVIKVSYDRQGHDVLEMLTPFVADCARRSADALSDASIQTDLMAIYGLPVPRTVIKTLLGRLARAGAVTKRHGTYAPMPGRLDRYDLTIEMSEVNRLQASLLKDGVDFAARVFDTVLSEDELSSAILSLVRQELIPLTVWAVRGGAADIEHETSESLEQIAAQFVLYVIAEGDAESRTALEQIAKGCLLSGVLWTTDLDAPRRRINGLELYLDTTLLLRLLGVCGPHQKEFAEELIVLARESGIGLFCFEHTKREIGGVLHAAASAAAGVRRRYFGEAVEFMVSEGWSKSDVEELISALPERLSDCGVQVRETPDREARFTMDEDKLRDLLDSNVRYTNPVARDTDLDSFASIFTLRAARRYERIEDSRAIFVTTNVNLAKASRRLYEVGENTYGAVPLVLVDSQIAAYLWGRHTNLVPGIPLNLLAVGALSIAQNDPRIWLRFVDKIDELRTREHLSERDYTLLRQSLVARSIIFTATEGDVDAFTEDTADFVLKHALAEHARELQAEVEQRNATLEFQSVELAAANQRAIVAGDEVHLIKDAHRARFADAARQSARRWVIGVGTCVSVLFLAASIVSWPWPIDPPLASALPWWLALGLGIVAILLGAASLIAGFTVRGFGERLIDSLAVKIESRYLKRFSDVADTTD